MKYNVSVLSEAEIDIDTDYVWYERRQIGLGDKFYDSVKESVRSIGQNPFLYEEIYRGTRRCVIKKFPYGVYYKIIPDNNEIQILGVIHFKRDPGIIMERL
jgi:toxin ParE1/3/4